MLDRTVGSQGPDVMELQKLLVSKGYLIAVPTGYFGPMTMIALQKFQAASGIVPASGYLGPLTRAKLNAPIAPPGVPVIKKP
jgi:peptidoglycan hydrolase-like protein with peptidoglycan-binding domain